MEVIHARNVNDAFLSGLGVLRRFGERQKSRAGDVLVCPFPVTTYYHNPKERVLLHPTRDANHVFHLMESIWMLAGRNDARWLDQFIGDFSSRFAEEGGRQHGAYGFRWRHHFDVEAGGEAGLTDQLETAIRMLKANPEERRVVIGMWDPVADLGANKRDVPCNTHIYLRLRRVHTVRGQDATYDDHLDITVCCRSNDAIWGAYGANAVHFSVLQEYLAARLGAEVGSYYQISNNFHAYTEVYDKFDPVKHGLLAPPNPYVPRAGTKLVKVTPIVTDAEQFILDAEEFVARAKGPGSQFPAVFYNPFFTDVAVPLYQAIMAWKAKDRDAAQKIVAGMDRDGDWATGMTQWMKLRLHKAAALA